VSVGPVMVIGLDAAEPTLIERWMDQGLLPTMARLRANGTYTRLKTPGYCRAETASTVFLTGCAPSRTGQWCSFKFHPADYGIGDLDTYPFDEYRPFYALGPGRRVAVFDVPQTRLVDDVDGIQVLGWGAHASHTGSVSVPDSLLAELTARHGEHPTFDNNECALWDRPAMEAMKRGLETGIARRVQICRELLQREHWDLFLTFFGETHTAGHHFWHLSQPDHPLYRADAQTGDWMLEIFVAVDRAIGELMTAAPDASIVLFSHHGMESNGADLSSFVFLPELLYRWSLPGQLALEALPDGSPLPPPIVPRAGRSWTDEVWVRKHDPNPMTRALRRRLPVEFFHYTIEKRLGLNGVPLCPEECRLGYQPPMWYHPAWPRMRAFALPSFSEGYVRLNVRGRERDGIVDPGDYGRTLDEIEALVRRARNARTGSPLVDRVIRCRPSAEDRDPKLPDPDMVVIWTSEPADAVDTPVGRIGPMPFRRSGSHVERGFLLASGAGIPAGVPLPEPRGIDVAPTILSLMDVPIPSYMDGRPLVERVLNGLPD
jgi:predicted AlkP superfamily phosphohydrolase/phosphomutase